MVSFNCSNGSNETNKSEILGAITRLIILYRSGNAEAARTLVNEIEKKLYGYDADFSTRQRTILRKIETQYSLALKQTQAAQVIADTLTLEKSDYDFLLSSHDQGVPLPGVSLVAGCMNRDENLLKVLDSWLATNADEIVIVDWSSASELWPKLAEFSDPRLKVIRVDGEKHWVAAHALNVGLRFASYEVVLRVDCDIRLAADFLELNAFQPGEFIRGFWKSGLEQGGEGQQFIQGTFGAYKKDLRAVNYYDERILTYGWEDSELYVRMAHDWGLAGKLVNPNSLRHIEQSEEQRLANQNVPKNRFLGRFEPTEFEGAKNKFYSTFVGGWGTYSQTQDYAISAVGQGLYRGIRITKSIARTAQFECLSEILAIRQLTIWALSTMPKIGSTEEIDLEFGRVMRDAHAINKSRELVDGLSNGKGLYFIRCEEGPCRAALLKTLQVMHSHYPSFAECVALVEGHLDVLANEVSTNAAENVIVTHGALIEKLSDRTDVVALNGIGELEALLETGNRDACYLSLSTSMLATEVLAKARKFAESLGDGFETLAAPVADTCLVTSLYDEQNLIRLIEYLACVVENLKVFEQIIIYYESSNGLLAKVLYEILERLEIKPGHLLLLPYLKRPTFEELFSIKNQLPDGTIIAVTNADIVFDATFSGIKRVNLAQTMVTLSRRDISSDGSKATLIRLDNGNPNTYSADAWIVSTPFEPDFFLDYQIGTMHCDSFINHQLSTSERYSIINPCLDIRVFHLHDERFNSSAEKQIRDSAEIQKCYNAERERNGGMDPIKGIAWSTLSAAAIVSSHHLYQQWTPKVCILNLAGCATPSFGHFLMLHIILNTPKLLDDAVMTIKLRESDIKGPLGLLLARYQVHFPNKNFLLDIEEEFDEAAAQVKGTFTRPIAFSDVAGWFNDSSQYYEHIYNLLSWPAITDLKLLRSELKGDISAESSSNLFAAMRNEHSEILNSLFEFFNSLPNYSDERNLLTPFIAPQLPQVSAAKSKRKTSGGKPAVSFVTSLFHGGRFLPAYLENVYLAAREAEGEVIIIDANVDDADALVIHDFLDKNPAAEDYIDYVRLDNDPGLYECWKIAIERSKADFITNANIDDRRCPLHTARLVQLLKKHPEYTGACGSISCVTADGTGDWFRLYENALWYFGEGIKEIGFEDLYRINEHGEALSRDVMHCMPVWRKSLHKRYGYFDEASYGTSADWAFWLKSSKAGEKFIFDEGAFGRYFLNPDSHNRRNDPEGIKERRIIKDFIGIEQNEAYKQ